MTNGLKGKGSIRFKRQSSTSSLMHSRMLFIKQIVIAIQLKLKQIQVQINIGKTGEGNTKLKQQG